MYTCNICNLVFDNINIKANHVRWQHKYKNTKGYSEEGYKKILENIESINNKKFGKKTKKIVNCGNKLCNKKIEVETRDYTPKKKQKHFCNISCANTRVHSEKTKNKISKSNSIAIKEKWKDPIYAEKCLKNIGKRMFSSKGERELLKYLKDNSSEFLWKSGAGVKYKNIRIVRDMWSDEIKICVEYDGIWHFKDIKGQLKDKKKKDKALHNWCKENGYTLIRIKEDVYKKHPHEYCEYILNLIKDIINNKTIVENNIIKIYKPIL